MDNNSVVETVEFPSLKSINRQLFSLKDSITDLERRNIITYEDIVKNIVDEKSLTKNQGKIQLKYQFAPTNFSIDTGGIINNIGLTLSDGKNISADSISSDLKNASFNISSLSTKVDSLLKKLDGIGGYTAANNFKMPNPTETQLTNYAISCLSKGSHKITKSQIPSGTKIKNLYDNHIWVFNTISLDGLTRYTWEDFGSDNICIATNEGVKGLVTGSTDSLKGYIDINGVISINGLEETLTEMTEIVGALIVKVEQLEVRLENLIEK